jgi:leucyl aminopeptidase
MHFLNKRQAKSLPIIPMTADKLGGWLKKQDKIVQNWVTHNNYTGNAGSLLGLTDAKGRITGYLFGIGKDSSIYTYAELPARLPAHEDGYYIDADLKKIRATDVCLGWALGCYAFQTYKNGKKKKFASLIWPKDADRKAVETIAAAIFMARDLVNTPANDMGPAEIAAAARKIADDRKGVSFNVIVGEDLIKKNYPAIYAVGKGSPRAPRLIDMRWGDKKNPAVTLVGKGVAFDTGGLDIKPSSAMALMKKDMGGAAHVLALAQIIIDMKLPVRLRVLIPAVENSTDGNSFRPGDILQTRKGVTVEVGDTDAEGRLILCDALTEACAEKPKMVIDFATLTGAARVALGPEIPALFCNDDKLADKLLTASKDREDPLWRLPLWPSYRDMLNSKIADTNNIGGSFAGAITAALYMEKFIDPNVPWAHIDTFAWNASSRPGRPEGGEVLGIRAVLDVIASLKK